MSDIKLPEDMLKIQPDVGTIFANLNAAGVSGAIKDYCLARIHGADITTELAKSAYMEAQTLIDAGNAAGSNEISVGAGKTVSVDLLNALCDDIKSYAKFAASRQNLLKLANKFSSIVK